MTMSKKVPKTIDAYISPFPIGAKRLLKILRRTVKKAAPGAREKISYGMPAFFGNRNLVYFAGYKRHIGFYPGSKAIVTFKKEISKYKWAKGSIQFPLDEPLPLGLVTRIVKHRVKFDRMRK